MSSDVDNPTPIPIATESRSHKGVLSAVLVEIFRALSAPEVQYHLTPQFRNGEVTVTVRMVNGKVSYVQPVIKPEMKLGVDFVVKKVV